MARRLHLCAQADINPEGTDVLRHIYPRPHGRGFAAGRAVTSAAWGVPGGAVSENGRLRQGPQATREAHHANVAFYEAADRVNCVPPLRRIQLSRGSVILLFAL